MSLQLKEITLTATESNWRLFMVRKADPAFLAFQEKVFRRDQHTCQYCGFQAERFLEVINVNGNYYQNNLGNLATACPFCAQCFFLDGIGKSEASGGTLILLPEMTQGELNALCHVLFVAMMTHNSYATEAKNIYRSLKLRVQQVEKQLGEGLSNPSLYGHLLIDSRAENRDALHASIAQHLRVLPDLSKFVTQVQTWSIQGIEALGYTP